MKSLQILKNKGYLQGVFFITLVALTSNMNDILMRFAGRLPSLEVTFFRYGFATLSLLMLFILKKDYTGLRTHRLKLHLIRALLLCIAIVCWSTAVTKVPLAVMSTLALTVPLFVLPLSSVFLKEKVGLARTFATLLGFTGIIIIVFGRSDESISQQTLAALSSDYGATTTLKALSENTKNLLFNLNNGVVILMIASLCFALSDVINKKFVDKESTLSMMFYIAMFTALFALLALLFSDTPWVQPTLLEYFFLLCLGIGGNLILFFLLKAFAATEVSALAPYRYSELIFASIFGYFLFGEILNRYTYLGSMIIVLATTVISYIEINAEKNKIKNQISSKVKDQLTGS